MTIQLPPLAEIKAKGLAALDAGELQCQKPGFAVGHSKCLYSGPCAIGVALSPDDRDLADSLGIMLDDTTITWMLSGSVLELHADDDTLATRDILCNVQRAHDRGNVEKLRELLSAA